MTLKEYLNTISKSECPEECEFKEKKEIEIALVPPPNEIVGILISRDPTMKWLEKVYKDAKELPIEKRRKTLFETAIPNSLKKQIESFTRDKISEHDRNCLFDTLWNKVYWTHFHKCFTDASRKKSLKFSVKNANKCADKWLNDELSYAIGNKTKFIVVLGKEAQDWKRWKEIKRKYPNVKVINLLHPSPQNNRIWRRIAEKEIEHTENGIREWIKLCKGE